MFHVLVVLWSLKKSQDPVIYWWNYLHVKDASQNAEEGIAQSLLKPVERMWKNTGCEYNFTGVPCKD